MSTSVQAVPKPQFRTQPFSSAVENPSPAQNQEGDDRCVSSACVNGYHGDCADDIDGNCCDCDCHLNLSATRHSTVDYLPLSPGHAPITLDELWRIADAARCVLGAAEKHVAHDRDAAGAIERRWWELMAVCNYSCDLRMVYEVAK